MEEAYKELHRSMYNRSKQEYMSREGRAALNDKKIETRRLCNGCKCLLYVRSTNDTVANEKDLDEVFRVGQLIYCFRCAS